MKATLGVARRWLLHRVYQAPRWLNGSIDFLAEHVFIRLVDGAKSWRHGLSSSVALPLPVPVPHGTARILIAPANYAGQGLAWARAITTHVVDAGGVNLAVKIPGRLLFDADRAVPEAVYRFRRDWQTRELAHVIEHFTHVLVEAESPVFGSLFRGRPATERVYLEDRGISVAYISHGTDIRSPRRHIDATPFSPFVDEDIYVDRVQRRVDRNLRMLGEAGVPVFVSTPDLVEDFANGIWVPVVVSPERWAPAETGSKSDGAPRVLHTPSLGVIKGTDLIRDSVRDLADRGVVRYSEISGAPPDRIAEAVREADIVLDQFRLGSYGVAACEAMAAGKVVVGHVTSRVRDYVRAQTGFELPIVEATPATLGLVLRDLARDRDRMVELGVAGQRFVGEVHDGRLSASRLEHHWIRKK